MKGEGSGAPVSGIRRGTEGRRKSGSKGGREGGRLDMHEPLSLRHETQHPRFLMNRSHR